MPRGIYDRTKVAKSTDGRKKNKRTSSTTEQAREEMMDEIANLTTKYGWSGTRDILKSLGKRRFKLDIK